MVHSPLGISECYVPNLLNKLFAFLIVVFLRGGGIFTSSVFLLDGSSPKKCRLLLVGGRLTFFLIGDSTSISAKSVVIACFLSILWTALVKCSMAFRSSQQRLSPQQILLPLKVPSGASFIRLVRN